MEEIIDERNEFKSLVTSIVVDLNGYSVKLDDFDKNINLLIKTITLVYSVEKNNDNIQLIKEIKERFNNETLKLEIIENNIKRYNKQLSIYFEKYDDYKDEFRDKKMEVLRKINYCKNVIINQLVKCDCYLNENQVLV